MRSSRNRLLFLAAAIVLAALMALTGSTALSARPQRPAAPLEGVDHTETTTDDTITTTTPDVLVSATVFLSGTQGCVITGSAEVNRTSNATGTYVFGISMDTSGTTLATSDRRVEFVATADTDLIWEEVTTVEGFDNLSGTHTFFFSARKSSSSTATTTVTASGISVICSNTQLS
jgi:hypothetical protein